jgi:ATP-binding cassette subfamily C protein CydD
MRELVSAERPAFLALNIYAVGMAGAIAGFTINLAYLLAALAGYLETYDLSRLIGWTVFFALLRLLFSGLSERTSLRLGLRRREDYRRQLLSVWFSDEGIGRRTFGPVGEQIAVFEEATQKIEAFYQRFVPASLQAAWIPLILAVVALFLDWPAGLVLVITGPLIPVFMILIGKGSEWHIRGQWNLLERMNQSFLNTLRSSLDLLVNNREDWVRTGLSRLTDHFRRTTMKVLAVAFLSALVLEVFAMIGVALVAAQTGVRLVEGWMEFAPALSVLLLAPEFYLPFRTLGARHHAGMEAAESASRLFEQLDAEAKVEHSPEPAAAKVPDASTQEGLRITDLTFSWSKDPTVAPLLDRISLPVAPREFVALAGPSGAGKSTLFRLLLGLETPIAGSIAWNATQLREGELKAWRDCLAWVPQAPNFFPGSLRENLYLGREVGPDEELWEALEMAECAALVRGLPRGLNGPIYEAAQTFSTGERQRLALARALLQKAPLLLFDEPTASLDPVNEAALLRVMGRLKTQVSLLVIAHRRRTLAAADRVYYLEQGHLREMDTPEKERFQQ